MSSISAVGFNPTSQNMTAMNNRRDQMFSDVADLLGISADDLKKETRSGKSLSDIAEEHGVSRSTLLDAVKKTLATNKPEGAPEIDFDKMANDIIDRVPGQGHHGPPPPPPVQSSDEQLSNLAELLGIDSTTLTEQLQSGTSLSQIISNSSSSSNISTNDILDLLGKGLLVDHKA